jgi:iron complex transport system substrate-binding protein
MWRKIILGWCFGVLALSGFSQKAERVVSLTPSITENIYLIGAESQLVGCTSYCNLAVNDGIAQVGSAVNINVEMVLAMQPDLVLTMGLTKPQDLAALEKLGIKVVVINTPKTFYEICEQTLQIADLLGKQSDAQKIVYDAKQKVEQIKKQANKLPPSKIFFQIGSNPVFTVLEGTFMNDFITLVNGQNIAAGMQHGTITRESVLMKNPDVIIIAEMGGFGKEEQKIWNTYNGMAAVKSKKVFLISSETSCSPTPANFVSALQDVYRFVKR